MRLVNHPFRLDSQRLLSYLTSMRVLTLAVTPANSTTFWNTIYFYTASAAAGNLSYDCARGRHCTVSAAASRRHVDASLDLFTRKSPRIWRDIGQAPCTRPSGPSEDKLFGLNQQVDRTATMNPVLICLLVMVTFFFLLCDAARTGLAQGRAISPSP